MTDFKYRSAGALVELHEHHLGRFLVTWRAAREEDIELPDVDDSDYASLEALLEHAVMHPIRHRHQLEKLIDKRQATE